jgi:CheY-like chemotaxis protein
VGADAFLIKPVSPSLLWDTIAQIFGDQGREAEGSSGRRKPAVSSDAPSGLNILLVEDKEINRQVARELLESAGHRVTAAVDGREAVDRVEGADFDLVLMDVQMPVMDGYEAARRIRRDLGRADLPIIAMTANALAGDREKALDAGMNDHVPKPIDPDRLMAALIRWAPEDRKAGLSAAPRVSIESTKLPELPGLDVRTGLARTGGRMEAYLSILRRFRDQHAEAAGEIRSAMDQGDWETVRRLAHTLKGVAGNIGADRLHRAAAELETALKQESPADELIQAVDEELNRIVSGLAQAVASEKTAEIPAGAAPDPQRLAGLLTELLPAVRKKRPKQCAPLVRDLEQIIPPPETLDHVQRLKTLIEKYKFKEAENLIRSITEQLEP